MGAVYKARDLDLDRIVALKLMHPTCSLDNSVLRLKRELVLASRVSHPHVVRVYDFGELRGTKFISMAFIDGENLKSMLVREGRIPVVRAVHIATQLCEALDAAHAQGVVHRDLKPQNILLDCAGNAYISDFGLARSSKESDSEITQPGEHPGSPAYMSPQQALGLPVDHRSDLYSLGLVFYEMVTGRLPHAPMPSLSKYERADDPAILNPEVSEGLGRLILRCLEFDPGLRYQSASGVLSELKAEAAGAKVAAEPAKPGLRRPRLGLGIAALLLGGLAILSPGIPRFQSRADKRSAPGSHPLSNRLALIPLHVIGDVRSLRIIADSLTEAVSSRAAQSGTVRLFSEDSGKSGVAGRTGVDGVITGSVGAEGNDIVVTIHLTDYATGEERWTKQFRASPGNLLGLEDRIWAELSNALGLKPGGVPVMPALLHATKNLEAYKLYMQGKLILRMRRNRQGAQQAVPLFEEAAKEDPGYFYPFLGLADANLVIFKETHEKMWLEEAKLAARQAQDLSPNRPEAQIPVANIQIATGRYQDAIGLLGSALEMNPSSDEAYRALGRALLLSGHPEQALAAHRKAIELDPHSWQNYNSLGAACFRLGRTEEAEQAFNKAIELEPQIDSNYTDLGNTYLQSGKFREAIPIFEKAVGFEPDAINYSNLGTALFYLRQYRSSALMFQKAVNLAPESEEIMGNLADAYRWSNQKDKTMETYFRAVALGGQSLDLNPKDADTRGRIAVYYAKMDDFENARASIRTALALDPGNGSLRYDEAVISTLALNFITAKRQLALAVKDGYPLPLAMNDPELRPLY
jgi:eukaryotic-like serine/threonine-protein kinase